MAAALAALPAMPASADTDLVGRNHMAAPGSAARTITLTESIAVNRGGYYGQTAAGAPGASFALGATGGEFLAAQLRRETPNGRGYHPSHFGIRNGSAVHTLATDNILPPGRYQLMLLTDGRDPWLTLDVNGRSGEQQIPVQQALPLLAARAHDDTSQGLSRAGASLELPRHALLHARTWLTTAAPARAEVCEYKVTSSPSTDFGPGCPNGRSLGTQTPSAAEQGECCMLFTLFDIEPGFYAFGGNITSSAQTSADVYMAAVPYPPPSVPAPAPGVADDPRQQPVVTWATFGEVEAARRERARIELRCHDPAGCRGTLRGTRRRLKLSLQGGQLWRRTLDLRASARNDLRRRRRTVLRLRLVGVDSHGRTHDVRRRAVLRR